MGITLSTMAVDAEGRLQPRPSDRGYGEDGQSVLEFLFCLPIMVGLAVLLIRVNTAIQMSIVNQQYSRAQILFLTFNSPYYPEMKDRTDMAKSNQNQMVVGVAQDAISDGGVATPVAPSVSVVRSKSRTAGAGNVPQDEPAKRAIVRVRNTVTLCSQVLSMGGTPIQRFVADASQGYPAIGSNSLIGATSMGPAPTFCSSSLQYVGGDSGV